MRVWSYILGTIVVITVLALIGKIATVTKSPLSNAIQQNIPNSTASEQEGLISKGKTPAIPLQAPNGFTIHVFAEGLTSPRDLVFTPGGTLLVSDPSENQVIALPDKNKDGAADSTLPVIENGNKIHGLAFYKGKLFVAEVNKVVRYSWNEETLSATLEKTLFNLPDNNNHTNRTLVFDQNGTLYVSVGSTCNVCVERSLFSGSVIISDSEGRTPQVYAKGLRNAPFLIIRPGTNEVWSTGMGRDYLGDTLPPDEINILTPSTSLSSSEERSEPRDYGWPYCYGAKVHDDNFDPQNQHSCEQTEVPLFQIPAHSAPLGLTFITSSQFPVEWQGDLLVAYHGSWNRSVVTGYKVVRMHVNNTTVSTVDDFITGFQPGTKRDDSLGRPVDLEFDKEGNLYLSDDKAGNIYIIQYTPTYP